MAKLDKKLKKNKTDGKLLKAREEMAKDLEVAENQELSPIPSSKPPPSPPPPLLSPTSPCQQVKTRQFEEQERSAVQEIACQVPLDLKVFLRKLFLKNQNCTTNLTCLPTRSEPTTPPLPPVSSLS